MIVVKSIQADSSTYFLRLTAPASANAGGKGVMTLLANGQRLNWPDQRVEVNFVTYHPRWDGNFSASSYITLTADQLIQLAASPLTDYKLYIFAWSVKDRFGENFREQVGCIINAKPESVKGR